MNTIVVTPVLVAQNKEGWDVGNILTHPRLEHPIIADKSTIDGLLFTANSLYILSDRGIKAGDLYLSRGEIYKGGALGADGYVDARRIEAAYPTIEGLPRIPEWFVKLWAEKNGKVGAVEMDMLTEQNFDGETFINTFYKPIKNQFGKMGLSITPRLDSDQCVVLEVTEPIKIGGNRVRILENLANKQIAVNAKAQKIPTPQLLDAFKALKELKDNGTMPPPSLVLDTPQTLTPLQMAIEEIANLGEFFEGRSPATPKNKILGEVLTKITALLPAEETFAEVVFNAGYESAFYDTSIKNFKTFFEQYKRK